MKKQSKQGGITLIALVITIIVLLILAGITINLTTGENGIIRRAQEAGKNYINAANNENAMLQEFENLTDNMIINVMGNNSDTSTGGTTLPAPTYDALASKAKPGDYVEYDGGNGYTEGWQVLYNDSNYGLQIISSKSVGTYTLGASTEAELKSSYNNAVDNLNSHCAKYVNEDYATSGRCVGSNPIHPADATANTDTVILEWNGADSGCKVVDTNFETDYNAMKLATNQSEDGIHNLGKIYWLASRDVDSNSSRAYFRIRTISTEGETSFAALWFVYSDGRSNPRSLSFEVRPVITLKSEIQTSSGDGSIDNAFKLVAK